MARVCTVEQFIKLMTGINKVRGHPSFSAFTQEYARGEGIKSHVHL